MRLIDADKAKAELLRMDTVGVSFSTVSEVVIKVLLIGLIQYQL